MRVPKVCLRPALASFTTPVGFCRLRGVPRPPDSGHLTQMPSPVELLRPSREHLPEYVRALQQGWSPDNVRGPETAKRELAEIAEDPERFLERQVDRDAKGPPIVLPDGSTVPRLPGYRLWVWDGEFCGAIGFRWRPGTASLPPYTLGHIGYSIVPWKRRRGYATAALGLMLHLARGEGLEYVEVTTDPDNLPSQKVILANGGVLVEQFVKPSQYGEKQGLRYRIDTGS